ncbi:agmatine deiminase family protein [Furfurilactobacillus rossiae]|uniref:Peptidyl-arginine deiminase n=1 Tax=Furfurilactobacillus rossiae DSM 15814 TaxID=1114972 RepID=A0A0R1RFN7_9LACO|nr:agmatine deiminase family protein [Furfurilactobacillus rossiae]KRL55840.1 peptidyl-arginine deiminase [Furfurilactobacillus rossiae DSM 15814]QFR67214.1 hypothetical protein LR814_08915 [Furfurilactobacillus rossiae]
MKYQRLSIFMFSILLASLLLFLPMSARGDSTMIYTALPKQSDHYYHRIYPDLIQYNQTFSERLASADQLTSLTKSNQRGKFATTPYTYDDIWVRDVAPIITTTMVKFRYSPAYLPKADSGYLNTSFTNWLNQSHFNYHSSKLVLDGGNVQWNKGNAVVITNRVFKDNPHWSHHDIISELKHQLNVNKVVIVPAEPGDTLAHSDGMIKFLTPNTAFISDFEGNQAFQNKFKQIVKKSLPHVRLITLKSAYTDAGQYDKKIASARGLYINMLETAHTIYVPQFNLARDKEALHTIQAHTSKRVVGIPITKVSTLGGAVHCTTWDVPKKFAPKP